MKITVSKHTTIDWAAVMAELSAQSETAISELVGAAELEAEKLESGQTKTLSSSVGKITIRRAKD